MGVPASERSAGAAPTVKAFSVPGSSCNHMHYITYCIRVLHQFPDNSNLGARLGAGSLLFPVSDDLVLAAPDGDVLHAELFGSALDAVSDGQRLVVGLELDDQRLVIHLHCVSQRILILPLCLG